MWNKSVITIMGILILLGSLVFAEGIYHENWIDRNKNGVKDPYENPELSIDVRISDLLARMTLEEKTCQMGTIYGYKRILKQIHPSPEWHQRVWKDGVANIDEHCNGVRGANERTGHVEHGELLNEIQRWFIEETRLGIPVDFTNEGIRGLCHWRASNFPSQLGIGATFDRDLVRRIGEITGKEGRSLGYSNIYSPILDTVRDPRWGRTIECYGESPYLVGELGKQQVLGLQSQGVASTPKHFAVYSHPNGGRDAKGRTDPQIPFRDMQEILLHPFQKVFTEAWAKGTMSSYNTFEGIPVSANPYFLTQLLRKEYGFRGYVVSDSGAVTRLHQQHGVAEDFEEAIVQAVNAGLNVRTNFKSMENFVEPLRKLIREGRIGEATINTRVADVLRVKFELGLFDKPFVDASKAPAIIHQPTHEATTLEAARKAIVLLKNDQGVLPLDPKKLKTILVTGPGADDVKPMISRYGPGESDVITPLTGIQTHLGKRVNILHTQGADFKDARFPGSDILPEPPNQAEQAKLDKAIALAQQADVIITVVGDDHTTVGESLSRTSLNLAGHQLLLVKEMVNTGKPVIVVLMAGRAASIKWIDQNVPSIMVCWHGGEKVGQAVAEVLFGKYNPGGKLPLTFPQTVGQLPLAVPHRNGAWGAQNKSADENGWGASRIVEPLYYFGHGLSYTTFAYRNLKIEPAEPNVSDIITISCDVTNTGDRGGDEVVQLYIKDVVASVAPFEQLLRGFERVSLKPGQSRTVRFVLIPKRDLTMLNRDNQWVVEPGRFDVKVGTSSAETGIKQQGHFMLRSGSLVTIDCRDELKPTHLYLLIGQSNMAGRGMVETQDRQPNPRVLTLNHHQQWVPAIDPIHFDKSIAGVGPGRSFGIKMAEHAASHRIGLIPCAVGGTSIRKWQPGAFDSKTKTHPYDDMLQRLRIALASGAKLNGILWHQGESDRQMGEQGTYRVALTELIQRVRQESNDPLVPFVIGQLGQFEGKPWVEGRVKVDQAHQDVAATVPNVGFVSSNGLIDKGDLTHFDAPSARLLGERFAKKMIELQNGEH